MFNLGTFESSAGITLDWKIECDKLSDQDWFCIAHMISRNYRFCIVHGVPTGGTILAEGLRGFCHVDARKVLIVDDVITTGQSMERMRKHLIEQYGVPKENIRGVALFSRMRAHKIPVWIDVVFQLNGNFIPA